MTGMVSRLEELGFVRRKGHASDLRASSLELTAKGEKVINRSARAVGSWAGEVFGSLPNADRKALPRSVEALVSALESR
jgi:DNA-binding MarR family transcriptional regulator